MTSATRRLTIAEEMSKAVWPILREEWAGILGDTPIPDVPFPFPASVASLVAAGHDMEVASGLDAAMPLYLEVAATLERWFEANARKV